MIKEYIRVDQTYLIMIMQNTGVQELKQHMTHGHDSIEDFRFEQDSVFIPTDSVHAGWIMLVTPDLEIVRLAAE